MKTISLLLVFILSQPSFSQSEFQIEIDAGYAFQGRMMLNNEELADANSLSLRFGMNYLQMLNDKFYLETGLYGKYNRGNRKIETLVFTSNNFKGLLPLYIGYKINNRWKFGVGASIENNKDYDDINFKTENENLRYDFITKLIYSYTDRIKFSLYTNWMLHDTPDVYTISSPRNGMYLGAIYQLGKTTNPKNKE